MCLRKGAGVPRNGPFHSSRGCRTAIQVWCAGQHFMCVVWFAVFGNSYLLLYHLFHSLLCTIDVPMCTAGESSFGDLFTSKPVEH